MKTGWLGWSLCDCTDSKPAGRGPLRAWMSPDKAQIFTPGIPCLTVWGSWLQLTGDIYANSYCTNNVSIRLWWRRTTCWFTSLGSTLISHNFHRGFPAHAQSGSIHLDLKWMPISGLEHFTQSELLTQHESRGKPVGLAKYDFDAESHLKKRSFYCAPPSQPLNNTRGPVLQLTPHLTSRTFISCYSNKSFMEQTT